VQGLFRKGFKGMVRNRRLLSKILEHSYLMLRGLGCLLG
jgi:hypothetical protein